MTVIDETRDKKQKLINLLRGHESHLFSDNFENKKMNISWLVQEWIVVRLADGAITNTQESNLSYFGGRRVFEPLQEI